MAYTQEQITALEKAIAEGVRRVRYADKEVEYRDLEEMKQILQTMKNELGLSTKSVLGTKIYPRTGKGL